MRLFFTSQVTNRIDDKGRVSIPAAFRKVLDAESPGTVVLVPDISGRPALDGMSELRHNEIVAALAAESPIDPEIYALQVTLVGEARPLSIDANGRIVLPPEFREHCGLVGDSVLFVGLGGKFQMWDPESWAAAKADLRRVAFEKFGRLQVKSVGAGA